MEEKIAIYVTCSICGEIIELQVYKKDALEYMSPNRRHVQEIFPYLSTPARELLISHICPRCWDYIFGGDEEK